MASREHRLALVAETLGILRAGGYVAPSGARVRFDRELEAAVTGTLAYAAPTDVEGLLTSGRGRGAGRLSIEVTDEKTQVAVYRLAGGSGHETVAVLNFASARNPGGGFARGARAQEEDLALASGLVPCLQAVRHHYEGNRACGTFLYTDSLIWSPDVPWFRDGNDRLLERPHAITVASVPAPNVKELRRAGRHDAAAVRAALTRRARMVFDLAWITRQHTLVLGAWGCGVFGNDPDEVAGVFAQVLRDARGRECPARIVFAVYDPGASQSNLKAFRRRFGHQ